MSEPSWKFDERKGIASRLGDHPFEHRLVESRRQDGLEKRQGISTARVDRRAGMKIAPSRCSPRASRRSAQSVPPNRRRATNASAAADRVIQPVRIVDHAEERLLRGRFRDEAERRQPDEERTRRSSTPHSESDSKCFLVRAGKTLGELEDWRAKNLQCRVVEVDFSLDARGPNGAKVLGRSERIFEKSRLADAGVAVQDEHRTFATLAPRPTPDRALPARDACRSTSECRPIFAPCWQR